MKLKSAILLVGALTLAACGTTFQSQEGWIQGMSASYPAGTPLADVEAGVAARGMTFEPVPNAFRILPRAVTGDGSGRWYQAVMFESTPGCNLRRTAYFRFDEAGALRTVYSGDAICT